MIKVTPDALRVAIADADGDACSRLLRLIDRIDSPPIHVVLECESAWPLLDQGADMSLDAVFADTMTPGGWSLPEAPVWGRLRPDFVFLTSKGEHAARAFELEAMDCLMRPIAEERLAKTLERLWRRRRSAGSLGPTDRLEGSGSLSARQSEILDLLDKNLTNKEIARILGLSHFTVRNHVVELFRLFGVSRRGDLARAAAALGLGVGGEARRRSPPSSPLCSLRGADNSAVTLA